MAIVPASQVDTGPALASSPHPEPALVLAPHDGLEWSLDVQPLFMRPAASSQPDLDGLSEENLTRAGGEFGSYGISLASQ